MELALESETTKIAPGVLIVIICHAWKMQFQASGTSKLKVERMRDKLKI